MSDLEKPWVERRRSGPPSSCPVCGAATMEVRIAGVITCRTSGLDHFEWRPDAGPVVSVPSERADRMRCISCHAQEDDSGRVFHEPECAARVLSSGADNQRYDKSLTSDDLKDQIREAVHRPGCPRLNLSGACACPPLTFDDTPMEALLAATRRLDDLGRRPPPPPPLEGEIMGRDFVETAERRLHPDAAALASLHRPVFGRPPYCWGCTSPGPQQRINSSRRVVWPCRTAELALEMMELTASDIAITDE